ncbi:MAG: right-handed parallel beta-helix repeat-containing protein [Gemmataceae bacterium]
MRKRIAFLLAGITLVVSIGFLVGFQLRDTESKHKRVIDAGRFPNLQAAFDAVPENGGIVRIPPGEYTITEPLVINREDTRVEGSGSATHIINKNYDGQPAFILRSKEYPKKKNARVWRIQLADFRISGNPKSGDAVLAQGVNEIYVSGLSIDHNGGHGINLVDCYEDPRISDSIMTYNAKAGLNILRGHDIVVNANQFEENQDAVRCIDSFNLCMNGNNLDDHLRHGVVIENTYGSVVSGNMIEECNGTAIIMDRDCYGNTVSANVIAHNMGGGVDLKDAWGCAVSANTFTIVKTRGLVVSETSGRITITGNNFSNSYIGGKVKREDPATGVVLRETEDIAVTGNVFTGLSGPAVIMEGKCQRIVITGNAMAELYRKQKNTGDAVLKTQGERIIETTNSIEKKR